MCIRDSIDIEPDWVHLGLTSEGITLNSYFIDHPEMVLGEITTESTQYGKEECTVIPIPDADLGDQLHEAVQHLSLIHILVSGLVKTYEAVKGADVLMQPERKVIGSCPACGSDVCETAKGWFCRDKNCKFALWKENRFFQTLGKPVSYTHLYTRSQVQARLQSIFEAQYELKLEEKVEIRTRKETRVGYRYNPITGTGHTYTCLLYTSTFHLRSFL